MDLVGSTLLTHLVDTGSIWGVGWSVILIKMFSELLTVMSYLNVVFVYGLIQ